MNGCPVTSCYVSRLSYESLVKNIEITKNVAIKSNENGFPSPCYILPSGHVRFTSQVSEEDKIK